MEIVNHKFYELVSYKCLGTVYIFNQSKFEASAFPGRDVEKMRRLGTEIDVSNLTAEFSKLHFECQTFQDFTVSQISDELARAGKKNYSAYGCVIVVILTHGGEGGRLFAYDGEYRTSDVWEHFIKNPSLKNKPKVFLVQSCRGERWDIKTQSATCDVVPYHVSHPDCSDCLVVYSTSEGYASWRSPSAGSWFIRSLSLQLPLLQSHGLDLLSIVTRAIREVIDQDKLDSEEEEIGQTPTFVSTLCKLFVLDKDKYVERLDSLCNISTTSTSGNNQSSHDDGESTGIRLEDSEYAIKHEDKGPALVLFDKHHVDIAKQTKHNLSKLNFSPKLIHLTTRQELEGQIQEISQETTNIFFLVIFSKLEHDSIVLVNEICNVNQILKNFAPKNCKKLSGKPKIFLLMNNKNISKETRMRDQLPSPVAEIPQVSTQNSDLLVAFAHNQGVVSRVLKILEPSEIDLVSKLSCALDSAHDSTCAPFSYFESSLRHKVILRSRTPRHVLSKLQSGAIGVLGTRVQPPCREFCGRLKETDEILKALTDSDNTTDIDVCITGPPGIGKTQLLYNCLHSHFKSHKILWIHAISETSIKNCFTREAFKLNIEPGHTITMEHLACDVYRSYVDKKTKTVLVFDDASQPEDIDPYFPPQKLSSHFHIMVTSVNTTFDSATSIRLKTFSDKEAKQYVENIIIDPVTVERICVKCKHNHGNIPAFLHAKVRNCLEIQLEMCSSDSVDNTQPLLHNKNILAVSYNKNMRNMFDQSIKLMSDETLDLLKLISFINLNVIPTCLFDKNYQIAMKELQEYGIIVLENGWIKTNMYLRAIIKLQYTSEERNVIQKMCEVIQDYEEFNKVKNVSIIVVLTHAWRLLSKYNDLIRKHIKIAVIILNSDYLSVEGKTEFYDTNKWKLKQIMPSTDENYLKIQTEYATLLYQNRRYQSALYLTKELITTLRIKSSIHKTEAKYIKLLCETKLAKVANPLKEFDKLYRDDVKQRGMTHVDVLRALKDAHILATDFEFFKEYLEMLQTAIEKIIDPSEKMSHICDCVTNLTNERNFTRVKLFCDTILSTLPKECNIPKYMCTILSERARCNYILVTQRDIDPEEGLSSSFSTYQFAYAACTEDEKPNMLRQISLVVAAIHGHFKTSFLRLRSPQTSPWNWMISEIIRNVRNFWSPQGDNQIRIVLDILEELTLQGYSVQATSLVNKISDLLGLTYVQFVTRNGDLMQKYNYCFYLLMYGKSIAELQTALHRACKADYANIATFLCNEVKACPNRSDESNDYNALHAALQAGSLRTAQKLVTLCNGDVKFICKNGYSMFHVAVDYECTVTDESSDENIINTLKFLHAWRADAKIVTDNGISPLHIAVERGNMTAIRLLVKECKVDVNTKTNVGVTPLHLAIHKGNEEVVKCLAKEYNAKIDLRPNTLNLNHSNISKFLIEHVTGENIFYKNDRIDKYALHIVIKSKASDKNKSIILSYLVRDCKCNVKVDDYNNNTILHTAALKNCKLTVDLIIREFYVNVNISGENCDSAAEMCLNRGNLVMYKYLVNHHNASV